MPMMGPGFNVARRGRRAVMRPGFNVARRGRRAVMGAGPRVRQRVVRRAARAHAQAAIHHALVARALQRRGRMGGGGFNLGNILGPAAGILGSIF